MVYCLLLSLLIGKVWAAIMHCLPYLITFKSPSMHGWSLISFSSTLVQLTRQSESQWSLIQIEIFLCRWKWLSICTEFLSDRRQRVVADGAESECIPIISGMPQGSVLSPLFFIIYANEMFDLVENRLFAYLDDSTLLAVVRKPAGGPAVCCLP